VWLIAVAIAVSGLGIGIYNNPAVQRIMAVGPEDEKKIAEGDRRFGRTKD